MADNVKIGYSRRIHKKLQAFLFHLMGQTSFYDKDFTKMNPIDFWDPSTKGANYTFRTLINCRQYKNRLLSMHPQKTTGFPLSSDGSNIFLRQKFQKYFTH